MYVIAAFFIGRAFADPETPGEFVYRASQRQAAAVCRAIEETMEERSPVFPGRPGATDERLIADMQRNRAALRITNTANWREDIFLKPDYLTTGYNRELDRAAAFARGMP